MTAIKVFTRRYEVVKLAAAPSVMVSAIFRHKRHTALFDDEYQARCWLGDMGLGRRPAKRILDAELRDTGILANPGHPWRVAADLNCVK